MGFASLSTHHAIATLALLLGANLLVIPAQAQKAPVEITDLNSIRIPTPPKHSVPEPSRVESTSTEKLPFLKVGSWVYFAATTEATGRELFRFDGIRYELVADINPGKASSHPSDLTAVGSRIYFNALTSKFGYELWTTRGTRASTVMVADISPGFYHSYPTEITRLGTRIVFRAFTPKTGYELFISDGTKKGTKLLKDMTAGTASSSVEDLASNLVSNRVFFQGPDGEPWVTDGTNAGTRRILDLRAGVWQSYPQHFTPIGPLKMLFDANDGKSGNELWITDGTAKGTSLVKDILRGRGSGASLDVSSPIDLAHRRVIFIGYDGTNGYEPWITDGTTQGTYMLVDGRQGSLSGVLYSPMSSGKLCYFATHNSRGGSDIYVTDGTKLGTRVFSAARSIKVPIYAMTYTKGKVFFVARDLTPNTGFELGVTDGTVAGTRVVKDIHKGIYSSFPAYLTEVLPGSIAFTGDDGLHGIELWYSSGTAASTKLFDINREQPGPTQDDQVTNILPFFGRILFTANDGKNGNELFISDGTKAGTAILIDIKTGKGSSNPSDLTLLGKHCIFQADDGKSGSELWMTDGTKAGTKLLVDIERGPSGSAPASLTRIGDRIYFTAYQTQSGSEAWITDGTAAGTRLVADLMPGTASSYPSDFAGYRSDQVVFAARLPNTGYELILTDGTQKGTRMLKDISASNSSFPMDMALMGGKVYFSANDGKVGAELWVTDFTSAGTNRVKDIFTGPTSSNIGNLLTSGDRLYFSATTAANGNELWESDGTASGTRLFLDLVPGSKSSDPRYLTAVGSRRLYFSSSHGGKGNELQSIDLATKKVMSWDIHPTGSSNPRNRTNGHPRFAVESGFVYLGMSNSTPSDHRLWRVDNEGTATPIGQISRSTRSTASDPTLGGTVNVLSTTVVKNPVQILLVGTAGNPALVGPGSYSYINLGRSTTLLAAIGSNRLKALLPIRKDKSLIGVRVVLQTWAFDPSNFSGSLEASNGIHLTIGY